MEDQFKYGYLSLKPLNTHESHLFRQFRLEDVYQQYQLYAIIFVIMAVAQVVNFIFTRDVTTSVDAVNATLLMLLVILTYKLGARMQQKNFQNCITALFCVFQIFTVVSYALTILFETSKTEQTLNIKRKITGLESVLMLTSMFQCSSIAYEIICISISGLAICILDFRLLQLDDQTEFLKSFVEIPGYLLASFVIWYILQKRELKSFIRERQAIIKQEQLTGLFDSQGDAIVVVQVEPKPTKELQPDESQDLPNNIVFCNKKSTQLFGYDLSAEQSQEQNVAGFLSLRHLEGPDRNQFPARGLESLEATEQRMQQLHSLKEILTRSSLDNKLLQAESQNKVEMYRMVTVDQSRIGQNILFDENKQAKTIVVNRRLLNFNDKECFVINFTDISAYEDLKKQHEAYNSLKKLNAQVHHEMLVPLKVNVEMADRLLQGNISGIQKRLVKNIYVSSNMVMLHAHDFLDQSLIEKGVFVPHYTPCSLAKIILQTISIVEITLEGKQLEIACDKKKLKDLPMVKLDVRRFQQVFLNLLNNATKFQDRGQIVVEVSLSGCIDIEVPDDLKVEVTVNDQGIGMTEEQLQSVFTPFNLSKKRGEYGGNGVGLSICKAICDSLKGHIEFKSKPGQGTMVTFSQMCQAYTKKKKTKRYTIGNHDINTISEKSSEYSRSEHSASSRLKKIEQCLNDNYDLKLQDGGQNLSLSISFSDMDKNEAQQPAQTIKKEQSSIEEAEDKVPSLISIPSSLESQLRQLRSDSKRVSFQGLDILIDHLEQEPFSIQSTTQISIDSQSQRLLGFLNANQSFFSSPNHGTIVVVDDQYVSRQSVMLKVEDLGITNKLVMLSNGQEACEFFEGALNDAEIVESSGPKQPVCLLLIDINMPIMTGMEAVKSIKQKYERLNETKRAQGKEQVARPAIFYYSQYSSHQMQVFIKPDERADFYLEKPVPEQEFQALFSLLNIPIKASLKLSSS